MRKPGKLSLSTQACLCAGAAVALVVAAYATAPGAAQSFTRITHVFVHEIGHLMGGTFSGRTWVELDISRNEGHVITRGGPEFVGTILMGPLLPALLAALCLACAATQRGTAFVVPMIGFVALCTVILGPTMEQVVDWALYGIIVASAVVLFPMAEWGRSIVGFVFGIILSIGTLNAAKRFGKETYDPDKPSDAYQLVEQLATLDPAASVADARAIVLGLLGFIYIAAAIFSLNTLIISKRSIS